MSWLNDYMDASGISPADYNHKMTMSGSKVEAVENTGAEIINVVTAKILTTEKHPDADKLVVCSVDIGREAPVQIVTAAKNAHVDGEDKNHVCDNDGCNVTVADKHT